MYACALHERCTLTPTYQIDDPPRACVDCGDKQPPPAPPKYRWVACADLAAATVSILPRIPHDIGGVVGVPRSGMIPASMLAALLHVPLYEMHRGGIELLGRGIRGHAWPLRSGGRLLVVDDTVYSGYAMERARQIIAPIGRDAVFAAIYVRPESAHAVDLHAEILPDPHILEWNLWASGQIGGHSSSPHLRGGVACDMDGLLCANPPIGRGSAYEAWLPNAPPLYLPRAAKVPAIITARRERYRAVTEAWLAKYGVQYARLVMMPDDYPDPPETWDRDVAAWKADWIAAVSTGMYAESEPPIAQAIAAASGKPVICPRAGTVYT